MSEDLDDVTEHLVPLEGSLWRGGTRFDPAWMEAVLHPDFHEFGRSGRRWSREEVLAVDAVELDVGWPPQHLVARLVAPDVALLTYVVVDAAGTASNRSSLWLREATAGDADPASGWRLRFHQGGPTSL
ncbi:DUF4440 domain-containing protein [Aquipuribacter sp. MA13-6]|uniref:nuclear transport factor 2 family protein n=1 Tax=unclassified Aquipuribacter TaxID=2635084 RepID=UPI003EEE74FA